MNGFVFSAEVCRVLRPNAQRMFFFAYFFCCASKPGVAPAGDLLFFASPKKSKQKKGDPQSGSLRCASGNLRCSKQAGSAQTRCAQTARGPNPPVSPLLSPARTGWEPSPDIQYQYQYQYQYLYQNQSQSQSRIRSRHQNSKQQKNQFNNYAPWRVIVGFCCLAIWELGSLDVLPPRRHAPKRVAQGRADEGRALFERSEFARTPPVLSNAVTRSEAEGLAHPARLSFAYFSLAKQRKVSRLPGRHPACLRTTKTSKREIKPSQSAGNPNAHPTANRPPGRNPAHPAWARQLAPPGR